MSQTFQSITHHVSVEDEIETFGAANVVQKLTNVIMKEGLDAILEREVPRILNCADNLKTSFCGSARVVPSSEGISIAFNHEITADTFNSSPDLVDFEDALLGQVISL